MARYWIGTGDGNWGSTNNWSDSSGGATGFSVPTSTDDVIFDGNGNNPCTLNTSGRNCLSFTVDPGFTNTITHSQNLTVSGNVTLHTGYTIAGSGTLIINATSTITSGGKTWSNALTTSGAITVTLSGNFSVTGLLDISSVTLNKTTTETLTGAGGLTYNQNVQGTAKIILTGGTWSQSGGRILFNDLDLQGNITFGANLNYSEGTITYISGTIDVLTNNNKLSVRSTATLNLNGFTLNTVEFDNATSCTLTSNLACVLLTCVSVSTVNATTTETITTSGGLTIDTPLSGTAKVILTGGTWSGASTTGISNDLDLQGTITVSGNVYYRIGTLRYVSGTITVTSSTLNLTGTCTLNTNGMNWNNVTSTNGSKTVTLTSNFSMSGLLTLGTNNSVVINKTASETFTVGGGITQGINGNITGTSEIIITGGTWSSTASSGYIQNNLTFAGNVTIGTNVYYSVGTIKYTSGTITTTSSTLNIITGGSIIFDTNGITWSTISVAASTTVTINSLLTASLLNISTGAQTFDGTAGFTIGTLTCGIVLATTIRFKESITYTITTLFSAYLSRVGSIVLFTSSHASTKANIVMPNNGSNECNILASFTRIDASGGRTINTFNGTVTDCVNVIAFNDLKSVSI